MSLFETCKHKAERVYEVLFEESYAGYVIGAVCLFGLGYALGSACTQNDISNGLAIAHNAGKLLYGKYDGDNFVEIGVDEAAERIMSLLP